jgi:hypothetical protein
MEAANMAKEKQLMGRLADQKYTRTLDAERWLREVMLPLDVVATLSDALSPAWTVEREVDPSGELTIVVLQAGDGRRPRSAFAFYEDDGRVHVGTIKGETWQSTRAFPTSHSAVAAIISAATAGR